MDAETFEAEKYVDLLPRVQQAYKRAFDRVNDSYDSSLVHAIDQQVLAEAEPHYDDDRGFYLELPANPGERLTDVVVEADRFERVLSAHVETVEAELEREFDE